MNYHLLPDFEIVPEKGYLSNACSKQDFKNFHALCDYIYRLPYGRNADKSRLETVFSDGCGTCGTKHALLKQVAEEQGQADISLVLCMFRMNPANTPKVSKVLENHRMEYMPEAHNYLKYNDTIIDLTGPGFDPDVYREDILSETAIMPQQITGYKVAFHRDFLSKWLSEQPQIYMDLNALWTAREECIAALAEN